MKSERRPRVDGNFLRGMNSCVILGEVYRATHLSALEEISLPSVPFPLFRIFRTLMYSHISVLTGQMWYGQNLAKLSARPDASQK